MAQAADTVLVVEPTRRGAAHAPFNGALLRALGRADPGRGLRFLAEPGHGARVRELLAEGEAPETGPLGPLVAPEGLRARLDARTQVRRLEALVERQRPAVLLFASSATPLCWALVRSPRLRAVPRILMVHHGGLGAALRRPRFDLLRRLRSGRRAMAALPPSVRFLVLEAAILERVRSRAPELAERFSVLPHPLPPDLECEVPERRGVGRAREEPLRVGLLGLATPQKGLHRFLELAETAARERPGRFRFELVGRLHEDYRALLPRCEASLAGPPPVEWLPRSAYVARLRRLDLVLFPSTGGHYEATASGTLLDCAAAGVPVAASPSGLLASLEQEAGGALGPRLGSAPAVAALDGLTAELTREHRARYARALRRLRESRSTPRTAERLACLLSGREVA